MNTDPRLILYNQNGPLMAASQFQYNGNISSMTWATRQDPVVCAYDYRYDDLNQLSSGNYFRAGVNSLIHNGLLDKRFINHYANNNITTSK